MYANTDISDLFFNTDLSVAELRDANQQFTGYDNAKLEEEARLFLACLDRLGVTIPTVEELLADFRLRL